MDTGSVPMVCQDLVALGMQVAHWTWVEVAGLASILACDWRLVMWEAEVSFIKEHRGSRVASSLAWACEKKSLILPVLFPWK